MQPLLTPAEEADLLGIPERTLADWRYRGIGPPWVRIGRHVRYRLDATEAWLTEHTITNREAS